MKKKSAKKSDIIMKPVLMPPMPGMIGLEGLAPNVMWVPVKKSATKKAAAKKISAKNPAGKPAKPKTASKNISGKSKK